MTVVAVTCLFSDLLVYHFNVVFSNSADRFDECLNALILALYGSCFTQFFFDKTKKMWKPTMALGIITDQIKHI